MQKTVEAVFGVWMVRKYHKILFCINVLCAKKLYVGGEPSHWWFLHHNSNLMENMFCCSSIHGQPKATNFCICHVSTAVVSYAKFCSKLFIKMWVRTKLIFPKNLMEKNSQWNGTLFHSTGTVTYRQTFNIRCTLVGNKIVDHSGVVGAAPIGAAPTTSSFSA